MKLEVTVHTDDGKVICHQNVDKIESNASRQQMAKDTQIRQENVHQNSLNGTRDHDEKPKEKSRFSKLMCCCATSEPKESKPLTNQEKLKASQRNEPAEESSTESSSSEGTIVVPNRAPIDTDTITTSTPLEDFPNQKPDDQHHSGYLLCEIVEPENKPVEKKIRPKMPLRCDDKGHWPLIGKNSPESLCKMKNCQHNTRITCEKCNVHLCFNVSRNCFYKYHKQNCHILDDNSKNVIRSLDNTRKRDKPSNVIRTNRTAPTNSNANKTTTSVDRNKSHLQRRAVLKDAPKIKLKVHPAVRTNKIAHSSLNTNVKMKPPADRNRSRLQRQVASKDDRMKVKAKLRPATLSKHTKSNG